jgi:hypothetical protein
VMASKTHAILKRTRSLFIMVANSLADLDILRGYCTAW